MANAINVTIDAAQAMRSMEIDVHTTGLRVMRLRVWLGLRLMRLALWVMRTGVRIESDS